MAKKSRPVGAQDRGSVSAPRVGTGLWAVLVEGLEARWHLSASVGRRITLGKTFRPPSDTVVPAKTAAEQRREKARGPRTHTNVVGVLPKGVATPMSASGPTGFTAAQLRRAYGLDGLTVNGVAADGAGQTIAIIDAYDHPGFVSSTDPGYAASDLHQFSVAMGLPDPPSFTKINATGGTSYPNPNPGWASEIALDVEWAHAFAPGASIVLVEAASSDLADLIAAAAYARTLPGVSVVSMSFGTDGGLNGETYYDPFLTTPAGHAGVTFVAASGDHGAIKPNGGTTATGAYPAESPNVVAVGGTTLTLAGNGEYGSETAWASSGGGISNYQPKPAYQSAVTQSATRRTVPDVAILGDPATGVAVYDSYNNPVPGMNWGNGYIAGTSLSAPLWAGLIAVTNQLRAAHNQPALAGNTQTLPRLYGLSAADFRDITTGNNGYAAGPGYDLVTGRGTPVVSSLLKNLAGGNYTGTAFADTNANGLFEATDAVLSGVTVYNDANNNGLLDATESSAVTNAAGAYTLDVLGGATYRVRAVAPAGYVAVNPSAVYTGIGSYDGGVAGAFAFFPTAYASTASATQYVVRLDPTGARLQVFQNEFSDTPTYSAPVGLATALSIIGNGGDDSVTVNLANGNPLPAGGLSFSGGGQSFGDGVTVLAAAGGTSATATASAVQIGATAVNLAGVEGVNFVGAAGPDALTINGRSNVSFSGGGGDNALVVSNATFTANNDLGTGGTTSVRVTGNGGAALVFNTTQRLTALTLAGGGAAVLVGSGQQRLRVGTLSITGTSALNLQANALIVDAPTADNAAALATGYAARSWTGPGIRSSTAAADTGRGHALGYGLAGNVLSLPSGGSGTFLGETVAASALLVRGFAQGDFNFDGTVDIFDYLSLQVNFGLSS